MTRHWTVAFAIAGLYLLAGWALDVNAGLVRTVAANTTGKAFDVRRVDAIDLGGVNATSGGAAGVTANWDGTWEVPASALYDLALGSQGRSSWSIDGHLANQTASADARMTTRTVWLAEGFHRVHISYALDAAAPRIIVAAARTGRALEPLSRGALAPAMPRYPRLRTWGRILHGLLGWLALAAFVWAVRRTIADQRERLQRWFGRSTGEASEQGRGRWRSSIGPVVAWTALACILVHGALLRIDAITGRYGPVTSPAWLAAVQTRTFARPEAIRPAGVVWPPEPLYPHPNGPPTLYRSDPYIYLDAARKMSSFYAAHFREPVFPFVTRVSLRLLDGQDVAVSFASAFFSILAIWLTYILGAAVWSRPVGLLAAFGLSLDQDVVALGSLGWRDDAYMAAFVLCAYLMLRCLRAAQAPARVRRIGRVQLDGAYVEAAVLGAAAGLAILTRIMAVSFLVAGAVMLLVALRASWRRGLNIAGIAAFMTAIVAGPYFVNCWRVFGDPLYTFNVHGSIYSAAEHQEKWTASTAAYVGQKIVARPIEMLDTVAQGVTTYPFMNKWYGLDRWHPGLRNWASTAAIIGLVVLAASVSGRLLLITMVASLLPSSFTWRVDPDFRFTEHVYPALLIAAAIAFVAGFQCVRAVLVPRRARKQPPWRGTSWLAWASVVGIGVAAVWFVVRVSPCWVFPEMLRARESAMVTAGVRDGGFLDRGWSEAMHGGNVSMRVATGEGSLSLVLPSVDDFPLTLRMDPFPRPLDGALPRLPVIDVAINGTPLGVVTLNWAADRVGAYDLVLPRASVRRGTNHLVLHVRRPATAVAPAIQPGLSDGDAVGLWYVRVHPPLH